MVHSSVTTPLNTQTSASISDRAAAKSGEPFLRCQLPGPQSSMASHALVQMASIQEVLSLPVQRLSPMPNMPSCVLGLMNRGNRIFWLVDLGLLLGVSRLDPSAQLHHVVILRSGAAALGLAVQQVENMQWLGEADRQPPPFPLAETLKPFVQGISSPEDSSGCLILDAQAILQAPVLQAFVPR